MSWNDYVTSKLMNTVDANQHKLENVLEHGLSLDATTV